MNKAAFHGFFLIALAFSSVSLGQSSDQNFPTAIATSEISGIVKARDIGDARLTTYYYAFNGRQGDIFINVVTRNFSGDIDIFNADGIRPLTKMVIYSDSAVGETGRLVYLRKPERLLLRVQGRSPNDDPATFQIKFGGSFVALADRETEGAPTVERSGEESGVRVNSVGTILPSRPKPPVKKPVEAVARVKSEEKAAETPEVPKPKTKTEPKAESDPFLENKSAKAATTPIKKTTPPRRTPPVRTKTSNPPAEAAKTIEEKKPDPLANIRLLVQLKDGELIERPMSEVLRFSVDKGVLTVIGKDGKISKYSLLDVAKVTIE